jgi:hypothetical protein
MELLPYAHLTDRELTSLVLTKNDLTELEQELFQRLERALERIEDLKDGDDS